MSFVSFVYRDLIEIRVHGKMMVKYSEKSMNNDIEMECGIL